MLACLLSLYQVYPDCNPLYPALKNKIDAQDRRVFSLTDQHSEPLQSNQSQEPPTPANRATLAVKVGLDFVHAGKLLQLRTSVGRVSHVHHGFDPGWCCGHAAAMCEDVEGCFATVSALARGTNAAECEGGD